MADGQEVTTANGGLRALASGIAVSSNGLAPKSLAELMDFAQLMAKAGPMVGKSFRGNPGACLGIAMQAMQWGMSPFAVSQKAFVTGEGTDKETIGYEAQLVNAVVNAHAPIKEPLHYEYEGEGPDRVCIVSATLKRASKPSVYRSPPLKAVTGRSPLWKTDGDQQLGYYSSRAWARRYCPEVLMGVYTVEEIQEGAIIDVTPARVGTEVVTAEGVATTIVPKSSYQARKDGDWDWFTEAVANITCEDDADQLALSDRFLEMPRAWRESAQDVIAKHLEGLATPEPAEEPPPPQETRAEKRARAQAALNAINETASAADQPTK